MKRLALAAGIALAYADTPAQSSASAPAGGASQPAGLAASGSTAFCLYALPPENGNQRWINLGIVQYVDARPDAVQIVYGGGNLGSGHEAKVAVKSRDEAAALVNRMRQAAEDCARRPIPNLILKEEKR